jgi:hypothetical protein
LQSICPCWISNQRGEEMETLEILTFFIAPEWLIPAIVWIWVMLYKQNKRGEVK